MAIDGVKIIDSDDGHDIYNLIVERYRDGTCLLYTSPSPRDAQ